MPESPPVWVSIAVSAGDDKRSFESEGGTTAGPDELAMGLLSGLADDARKWLRERFLARHSARPGLAPRPWQVTIALGVTSDPRVLSAEGKTTGDPDQAAMEVLESLKYQAQGWLQRRISARRGDSHLDEAAGQTSLTTEASEQNGNEIEIGDPE